MLPKKKKFEVPEVTAKTISPVSLKIYKSKLNKLANSQACIWNVNILLEKQKEACEIIKANSKTNQQGRIFLSAIFYVLADYPNDVKVNFYNEFQKYKDAIPT